jgi:tRNA splicing ligase
VYSLYSLYSVLIVLTVLGTGKTTIANVLAELFVAVGLASNPTIVSLRKDSIPSNSPKGFFEKLGKTVQNGVLIVDELQVRKGDACCPTSFFVVWSVP